MTAHARPRPPSELALLVATEARLDRALAAARLEALALVDAARRRADAADAALTDEIARQQARITDELDAELAKQRMAIADAARAEIARYEAMNGDVLATIARTLAVELAKIANAEAVSS
jgi:hypothetical protein